MYELYGPKEIPFVEKKNVVSLCYRLMWNLKNTGKIMNFTQIDRIEYATYLNKLYCVITLNDEENTNFLFDLSKVYGPIPTTLNDKDFEVEPEGHVIMVTVNQIKDKIKDLITEKGKNANLEKVSYTKEKLDRDKNKQSDLTADKVEKILDTEKNTEIRKKVLEDFQDNLMKKLEKKGVLLTEEEED